MQPDRVVSMGQNLAAGTISQKLAWDSVKHVFTYLNIRHKQILDCKFKGDFER